MNNNKTIEKSTYHKNSILRIALAALSVALQAGLLIVMVSRLGKYATWTELGIQIISVILVIKLYSQEKTSAMKMPWIILILVLPIVGVSLYYLIGGDLGTYFMRKRYNSFDSSLLNIKNDDSSILNKIKETDSDEYGISRYISSYSGYPVYRNTDIEYCGDTSIILEQYLEDISKAEHFIFMEYFSIENSTLWNRILEVLTDRIKAGVEVRILYDDVGSIGYIGADFQKLMVNKGIKCRIFNQIHPFLNMFMNNRDHRKITVIDGKIGYTGGFNMTNEYFNITHPYGLWKDCGVRLEGLAVNSLTAAFLEMWNAPIRIENERDQDILSFFRAKPFETVDNNSFVQPYGDSPLDSKRVGEEVYLSMIEKAREYCYFMTPYLIITEEMVRALTLAAKRGVDVRIIVPGIPDKKVIYSITRSFYNCLVSDGVKIYEWEPGFVHSKLCLVDGKMGTCGSINLDYRSLYHHFEFGCFFNDKQAITALEEDFTKTFTECRNVTEKYKNPIYSKRLGQMILRLFAELL